MLFQVQVSPGLYSLLLLGVAEPLVWLEAEIQSGHLALWEPRPTGSD